MSLVAEAPGFFQVFSNGVVKRFTPQIAECSNIPHKYNSKDVTIHPTKLITARTYIPHTSGDSWPCLPILVYFHGGGFCIGSTTWLGYHVFLGNLSATAKAIVLSVDYQLAPENKLPTAYDDCYDALEWLGLNKESEPWLRDADLSSVFLSGDSAGGNIAHHVALKIMETSTSNIRVKGLIPIHPYFASETRTKLEMEESSREEVAMNDMFWKLALPEGADREEVAMNDMFWKLALPEGADRDYYRCNFEKREVEWGRFPAVLVFIAGLDFLKERGVMYEEFLKKKGVQRVSLIENENEKHIFHVWEPESEAAELLRKQMTSFMQSLYFRN